jgi:hypothetical protein
MQNCPLQKAPVTGAYLIIRAATGMVIPIRKDKLTSGTYILVYKRTSDSLERPRIFSCGKKLQGRVKLGSFLKYVTV